MRQFYRKMKNERLVISRNQLTFSLSPSLHRTWSNLSVQTSPALETRETKHVREYKQLDESGHVFEYHQSFDLFLAPIHRMISSDWSGNFAREHAASRKSTGAWREGTEGNVREPSTTPYWTFVTGAIVLTRRRLRPLVRRRDNRSPRMCRYNPRFYAAPHARPTTRGN